MKYSALDRARIVVEAFWEWKAIQGDKMDFLSWLRFNGLDINGDRYEYRN